MNIESYCAVRVLYIRITFGWLGVPQKLPTTAPSSRSERHLTVFYIDQIVPGFVVYYLNWSKTEKKPVLNQ